MVKCELEQKIAIVTIIDKECLPDSLLGQKKIYTFEGEVRAGDMQLPWLESQIAEYVRGSLSSRMFNVEKFINTEEKSQSATVMIEPYITPSELVILGGGHIALPMARIARMLGYTVTVVDDRQEFVSTERFPEADRRICCSFHDIKDTLKLGPGSSVLIVTRGHKHDLDCLRQVINYPLAYLGMIGSRRKIEMSKKTVA